MISNQMKNHDTNVEDINEERMIDIPFDLFD